MRFDPKRRLYINERGRALSSKQVKKQVERYVEGEVLWAQREARKVINSIVSDSTFFAKMAQKIEAWHKVTGTIAYGGRAQMDKERWRRLDRIITRENKFLHRWQDEIRASTEIPEGIVNRAGMYPNAAYSTFENELVQRESDNGVTLGRRVCESDGTSCPECDSAATEEFIPLEDIPDIGSLQCLNNCRCEIEFSVDGTEFRTSDLFSGVIGGQDAYGGSVEIQ